MENLLIIACVLASVVCFLWAVKPDTDALAIRRRLHDELIGRKRRLIPLAKSLNEVARLNRRLPIHTYLRRLRPQLEAGRLAFTATQFFVIQQLGAAAGLLIYFLVGGPKALAPVWLVVLVAAGWAVPILWLRQRNVTRQHSIAKDLPDVVDLLSLAVDAGADFMTALGRVVETFRPCPLTEELNIVLQEIRVGKRRREALTALAHRVKTPEVGSFSRALIQADRMGTGVAESLRILSEDMRLQRIHWADRYAQRAPLKMLLPLMLSLSSSLVIVVGPILLQFLRGGFGIAP